MNIAGIMFVLLELKEGQNSSTACISSTINVHHLGDVFLSTTS